MLAEAPRTVFASSQMSQMAQVREEGNLVSRDSFSESLLFPTTRPPTNSARPLSVGGSLSGMGGVPNVSGTVAAPTTRASAAAEKVADPVSIEEHVPYDSAKLKGESVLISTDPLDAHPGQPTEKNRTTYNAAGAANPEGDPGKDGSTPQLQFARQPDTMQQDGVQRSHSRNGTPIAPSRQHQQLPSRTSAVEFLQVSQAGEMQSASVDSPRLADGSTLPALQHRGSALLDHVSGDLILGGSNPKRSAGPQADAFTLPSSSVVLSGSFSLKQSGTQARHSASAAAHESGVTSDQPLKPQTHSSSVDMPSQGIVVDSTGEKYDLSDPFDRFHWLLTEESPRQQSGGPKGATATADGRKLLPSASSRRVRASVAHDIQAESTPTASTTGGQHISHDSTRSEAWKGQSSKSAINWEVWAVLHELCCVCACSCDGWHRAVQHCRLS